MIKASIRRNGRAMFTLMVPVYVAKEELAWAVYRKGVDEKWSRTRVLKEARALAESYGSPLHWPEWEDEDEVEQAQARKIVARLFPELDGMERILKEREKREPKVS